MKTFESKHLQLFLGLATAAGALITIILYFENKEERKNKKEIAKLDVQIKQLDLANKQRQYNDQATTV